MELLAALLLSAAPTPTISTPPAAQARATATARVRILSPLRIGQGERHPSQTRRDMVVTHQAKRRDGMQVIDAY